MGTRGGKAAFHSTHLMGAKGWDKASVSEGLFQPFRSSRRRRLSSWLAESRGRLQRAGGIGVYRIIPKHLQTFVSLVCGSKRYDSPVTYTPISRQLLLVLARGCWLALLGTTMPPRHAVSSPSPLPRGNPAARRVPSSTSSCPPACLIRQLSPPASSRLCIICCYFAMSCLYRFFPKLSTILIFNLFFTTSLY